jgi:hypothetical protein
MHEPTQLEVLDKFPRKGGRSLGGRRWNVWYYRLRCPVCGREFTRLCNPDRGRRVRCVGRDAVQVTKRD